MTRTEAAAAARSFIKSVTKPDRPWTVRDLEAHLPAGWQLEEYFDLQLAFPLTVKNLTDVIVANAERA